MQIRLKSAVLLLFITALLIPLAQGKKGGKGGKGGKAGYEYYVVGDPADVTNATTAGLLLMGGGSDVDAAFEWMCAKSGPGE